MLSNLYKRIDMVTAASGLRQCWLFAQLALLAWLPALVVGFVVPLIYTGPESTNVFVSPYKAIAGALIIAPYLETQSMRLVFFLLGKGVKSDFRLILYGSFLWVAAHMHSESWGLYAIWPFFVFGACFLRLRAQSMSRAVWTTTALHALCNAFSYTGYLVINAVSG